MRRGKGALYLPPPGALGFVVAAFIDQRRSSEILKLFERMRAQVRVTSRAIHSAFGTLDRVGEHASD